MFVFEGSALQGIERRSIDNHPATPTWVAWWRLFVVVSCLLTLFRSSRLLSET